MKHDIFECHVGSMADHVMVCYETRDTPDADQAIFIITVPDQKLLGDMYCKDVLVVNPENGRAKVIFNSVEFDFEIERITDTESIMSAAFRIGKNFRNRHDPRMEIGEAVKAMRKGGKLTRESWNDDGIFIILDSSKDIRTYLVEVNTTDQNKVETVKLAGCQYFVNHNVQESTYQLG